LEAPFAAYQGDQPCIFVCYAHEDSDVVYPEMAWLNEQGLNVWYDEGISAGKNWRAVIGDSLLAASHVLLYISERSLESDHCNREINLALDEGKDVVPVYLEDVELTSDLKVGLNRVQALYRDKDANYQQRLLGALGKTTDSAQPMPPATQKQEKPAVPSIAVLPFVNMSSDPEQEYFVDGITEDLIDRLSRHSSLRVIARTSSFYFRDRVDDVRDIGTRLGVTHLVEGSVRRAGKKVRITAQLVRTDDGGNAWSAQYDRELDDVFALQDEITHAVTRELTELLVEPTTTYQPIPEAYDEYLRGQAWLRRQSFTAAQRARSFFDRAFEADPSYAEACAAAARALQMERYYGFENVLKPLELAADYVNKALALDPNLTSALVQKARVLAEWDFDIQASLDLLGEVLNRDPDKYEALSAAITVYLFAGRSDLAELAARKIIRMDPISDEANSWLFFLLGQQGRLDEAQEVGEALLALEPDNRSVMAILMSRQGRLDESLTFIEEHGLQTSFHACIVFARAGRRHDIEKVTADIEPRAGLKVFLTHCHALLGDIDGVQRALKEAIDGHDPLLWHLVPQGPLHEAVNIDGIKLGTIYNGPEVQEILRQVNLDQESIRRLKV
jgi:TolB-like protein